MLTSPPGLAGAPARRPRVTSRLQHAECSPAPWPSQQRLAPPRSCLRCERARGGGSRATARRVHRPTQTAAALGGSGDGGSDSTSAGVPLLWSDQDGLVDLGADADLTPQAPTEQKAALGGAAAPAAGRAQRQQQQQPQQQHQQQQPKGCNGPGGDGELSVLAAALSTIPEHTRGPFQLPDPTGSSSSPVRSPPTPSDGDDTGWALGPQAAALLLLTRDAASFEQVLALVDQHGPKLSSHHVAMLWCRMRQLLQPPPGETSLNEGGWGGSSGGMQQRRQRRQQEAGTVLLGGGSSSSGGAEGRARMAAGGTSLPPAAVAALRALCAPTARVGRMLPPLGVSSALASLAAAASRGFSLGRLQEPVRRRVKAQLCDALALTARLATPQQLAEGLLSLSQLGWSLRRQQLLEVSEAAAAAAAGTVAAAAAATSRSEAGVHAGALTAAALLAAVARVHAAAQYRERLSPAEQLTAAAALFDAYAAAAAAAVYPLDAGAADVNGEPAAAAEAPSAQETSDAHAAAAAAVLQAVAALGCSRELLALPQRLAALEAAVALIQQRMWALDPSHAAAAAVALRDLGAEPWPGWGRDLHAALSRSGALHALPGPLAVGLLSALPFLSPPPPEALVDSLARAASECLPDCPPGLLASAPVGLLALRHRPPRYWLDAFWAATAGAPWRGVPAMDLAGMVAAVAWLVEGGGGGPAARGGPSQGWCIRIEAALAAATLPERGGSPLPQQHREAAEAALAMLRAAEQQQVADGSSSAGGGTAGAGLDGNAAGAAAGAVAEPPLFPPTGLLPSILSSQEEDLDEGLPLLAMPPAAAVASPSTTPQPLLPTQQ